MAGGLAGLLLVSTAANARDFWQADDGYYPRQYYLPSIQPDPRDYYYAPSRRYDRDDERSTPRIDYLKAKTAEQLRKAPVPPPTKGPLMVVVSIAKQQLTLYDDGVAIARSRISTGVPSHPTPTGIFTVIQKSRWHRSNLYSDAPMPFMQRITWSGVALHAGVVPGHPASHGCIRMPTDFAIRMWRTTGNGTRVVVVQNDIAPAAIEHPALFKRIQPPAPPAESAPSADARLRPSLETTASEVSARKAEPAPQPGTTPPAPVAAPSAPVSGAKRSDADAPEPVKVAEAGAVTVVRGGRIETGVPDVDRPASEASTLRSSRSVLVKEVPPAQIASDEGQGDAARDRAEETPAAADSDPATASVSPPASAVPQASPLSPDPAPAAASPAASVPQPASGTPAADPSVAPAADKPLLAPIPGEATTLRKGPISVFVSRKERRLYVRKGFAPVFDVPVTIADAGKPIGTHVFTALELKSDGATMRWNVLTVPDGPQKPAPARSGRQKHKNGEPAAAAPLSPTASAAAALERIAIPENAAARISALMTAGASLIVSDEGLGPETGKETDFVVLTRN